MNKVVIESRDVHKLYNEGMDNQVHVLKGISMKIREGDMAVIMGPSGSGKTTLLDILGCLLKPSQGDLLIDGVDVKDLNEDELAKIRRKKIGFVFQQYNLIATFTAMENVEMPMRLAGLSREKAQRKAKRLLTIVGLDHRLHHLPNQLSGGEQQRVAIARSLANNPKIILADEPTGNLDSKTGKIILGVLKDLNKRENYTILMVSHDPRIRGVVDKVINLMDGKIIKEEKA
jgi:putative ABC transport system ATP-binding protein